MTRVSTHGILLIRKVTDDAIEWNPFTKEDALGPQSHEYMVYAVEKSLAERAVWDFVDQHPHVKVTACKHAPAINSSV